MATHSLRNTDSAHTTTYCGKGARYEDFGGAHLEGRQGQAWQRPQGRRISQSSY